MEVLIVLKITRIYKALQNWGPRGCQLYGFTFTAHNITSYLEKREAMNPDTPDRPQTALTDCHFWLATWKHILAFTTS